MVDSAVIDLALVGFWLLRFAADRSRTESLAVQRCVEHGRAADWSAIGRATGLSAAGLFVAECFAVLLFAVDRYAVDHSLVIRFATRCYVNRLIANVHIVFQTL